VLAGLSTRRYPVGLEPVGERVTETSSATCKSAVSRKFVAMTETPLAELLAADLSGLDLVALMIDGRSPSPAVLSPSGSTSTGPSTRWR
jgi:putative transposase